MEDPRKNQDSAGGLAFAVSAYFLWGLLPLYLKLLQDVPPLELLAHRIVWSVPVAAGLLIVLRRGSDLLVAVRNPRTLAMAVLTAALVGTNWGVYVWAITSGQALDAALGYYINPLFSVFLGWLLLGERLKPVQFAAVGLAAVAVVILTVAAGSLPWIAIVLTFSWGFYAFFKKALPIGPNQGFLLEVLILLPIALIYLGKVARSGNSSFALDSMTGWLLLGTGLITAVPLILYANGAKGLRLSTIGILQYIVPTMIFLIAVFVFDEPFTQSRMIAFPLIWAALALYTFSLLQGRRKPEVPGAPPGNRPA
ncbi:MAG TPA: EamA family transporter RarD [Rhodobacteraceae bacterium]|nr:EamA family transporter RarD [Paracoccaceae bacterium]